MHTEGHDMGKDTVGNTAPRSEAPKIDAEHPGYEITDVNVSGVAGFLAGLLGTVVIFFFGQSHQQPLGEAGRQSH
jgi:hypothetical protein